VNYPMGFSSLPSPAWHRCWPDPRPTYKDVLVPAAFQQLSESPLFLPFPLLRGHRVSGLGELHLSRQPPCFPQRDTTRSVRKIPRRDYGLLFAGPIVLPTAPAMGLLSAVTQMKWLAFQVPGDLFTSLL